jgi:DNA gyrase subunit A
MGRATQGVRLIKLNEDDEISSVAKIERFASIVEEIKTDKPGDDMNPEAGEAQGEEDASEAPDAIE